MKIVLLLLSISYSVSVFSQDEPSAFLSVGRGFIVKLMPPWELDLNANIAGAYRAGPGVMVIGYVDYFDYSFAGNFQGIGSTGSYKMLSVLFGAKVSAAIPDKQVAPYFMGAIGFSGIISSQDSIFGSSDRGELQVFHPPSGTTPAFLGAVGVDVEIYKGICIFFEFRTSAGLDSKIYDVLWMYRGGIGVAIF